MAQVAEKLAVTFGQGGDFTVVVQHGESRTEFKAGFMILCLKVNKAQLRCGPSFCHLGQKCSRR